MNRSSLLFLLVCLAGCATTTTQTVAPALRSRAFQADQAKVYSAVLSFLQDDGYPIVTADESAGKISTDYREKWKFGGNERSKMTLFMKPAGSGGGTEVQANIVLDIFNNTHDTWIAYNMTPGQAEKRYQELFDAIAARL